MTRSGHYLLLRHSARNACPRTRRTDSAGVSPVRRRRSVAIGGIQLMAAMDGPVAVFALPKIQNELGLVGRRAAAG